MSNRRISKSGDFSEIYRMSSTKFLLPELNFDYINLDKINLLLIQFTEWSITSTHQDSYWLIPSLGQPCKPELKVTGFLEWKI